MSASSPSTPAVAGIEAATARTVDHLAQLLAGALATGMAPIALGRPRVLATLNALAIVSALVAADGDDAGEQFFLAAFRRQLDARLGRPAPLDLSRPATVFGGARP